MTRLEAEALQQIGRRLSSSREWWGQRTPPGDRSVIRCSHVTRSSWRVRFIDVVGLVSVGDLQIAVQPKIPATHFRFLLAQSTVPGRFDDTAAQAMKDPDLWELLASWFAAEAERLLRQDLARDYRPVTAAVGFARGKIRGLETARSYYRGLRTLTCEFDEFDHDNPLNRVILAASRAVARSPVLDKELRARGTRIAARMWEVGELSPGDLRVRTDRTTARYSDALLFARHVLLGQGRGIWHGEELSRSFLIRTPELIEAGVRALLSDRLDDWHITKAGRSLVGSTMTMNPDLVFSEGQAVGDIKYKLGGPDWNRPDLNQVVTFATAFHSKHAAIFDFRAPTSEPQIEVQVGDVALANIHWAADPTLDPGEAADMFIARIRNWLDNTVAAAN